MREVRTTIEINAPPERVWEMLTDFDAYPEWNPFIQRIAGDLRERAQLEVHIAPPGGRGMTFRPTVTRAEPGRELRWLGRLLLPRLFDGEHTLRIELLDGNRSRFVQEERFRGLLVPVFAGALEKTEKGFDQMNAALKARAEET